MVEPHVRVAVSVVDMQSLPAIDEPVVVDDAGGAVVCMTLTDAEGLALADVPAGGLVAVYPSGAHHTPTMKAVIDPPDGSTVHFSSYGNPPSGNTTSYHVSVLGYPAATASVELRDCFTLQHLAVTEPTTQGDISDYACSGHTDNTVLAIALGAADTPIAWGIARDLPLAPGNVAPVERTVERIVDPNG